MKPKAFTELVSVSPIGSIRLRLEMTPWISLASYDAFPKTVNTSSIVSLVLYKSGLESDRTPLMMYQKYTFYLPRGTVIF